MRTRSFSVFPSSPPPSPLLVTRSDSARRHTACIEAAFLLVNESIYCILILSASLFVILCVSLALINLRHCLLACAQPCRFERLLGLSRLTLFPSRLSAPVLSVLCFAMGLWRAHAGRSLLEGVGCELFGESSPWCGEGIGKV